MEKTSLKRQITIIPSNQQTTKQWSSNYKKYLNTTINRFQSWEEPHTYIIITRIVDISTDSIRYIFLCDDGTGNLEIQLMKKLQDNMHLSEMNFKQDQYYIVLFSLRRTQTGDKKYYCEHIDLIKDFNIIGFHFLKVMSLYFQEKESIDVISLL